VSFALVSSIPAAGFQPWLSVGLLAEWQEVRTRPGNPLPGRPAEDVVGFVRYLVSLSHLQAIQFLRRPFLPDRNDDMLLKLALAPGCPYIITHNVRGCDGLEQPGVTALAPRGLPEAGSEETMSTLTVELPDSLKKAIEALAAKEGYTVSQFLASAAAEKLAVVLTMDYLRREAAAGRREDFERHLAAVPEVAPPEDDCPG
jgi:hypothetical protein